MRVAMPTRDGKIEPYFYNTKEFTIYEIEIELVKQKKIYTLKKGETFANFLSHASINGLICGYIQSSARTTLRLNRVELIYGVTGDADEIMVRYLSGEQLGSIEENAFWHL